MIMDMLKAVLGLHVPDPEHVKVFNAAMAKAEREFERESRYDLATRVARGVKSPCRKKSKARTKS